MWHTDTDTQTHIHAHPHHGCRTYTFSTELEAAMTVRTRRVAALRDGASTAARAGADANNRYMPSHILAESSLSMDAAQLDAIRQGGESAVTSDSSAGDDADADAAAPQFGVDVGGGDEVSPGNAGSGMSPVYVLEEGQLEMDELNSHECMVRAGKVEKEMGLVKTKNNNNTHAHNKQQTTNNKRQTTNVKQASIPRSQTIAHLLLFSGASDGLD